VFRSPKTLGHIETQSFAGGHVRRAQPFVRTWIVDVCIRNPGKHLSALTQHVLASGIQIGEDLNRYARAERSGDISTVILR
jgi:hypothetical protein